MTPSRASATAAPPVDRLPWMHVAAPRRGPVRGIAVVLHGGRERSRMRTRPWQAAVLRLLPFDWALRRAGRRAGLAVVRVRFRVRGWNADPPALPSPVADLTAVLDALAARHPGVPIALVGHSMGGRAAMRAGGHPAVRAIVGLAPWIAFEEPYRQLVDRDVLIVHGTADRWTDPDASRAYADAAAAVGARASYIAVEGATHSMLRHARFWHRLAAGYVIAVLPELAGAGQTAAGPAATLIQQAVPGGLRTQVAAG